MTMGLSEEDFSKLALFFQQTLSKCTEMSSTGGLELVEHIFNAHDERRGGIGHQSVCTGAKRHFTRRALFKSPFRSLARSAGRGQSSCVASME